MGQWEKTFLFITKTGVPQEWQKDVTYGHIVSDNRKGKVEPNRTRLTVRRDRINDTNDCGMPTADLPTIKILFNSVISTLKAKLMTMDIKTFFV